MNPAMAGLGALTKRSGQPTGRSPESMSQTMALAKQMSDMQLADVLAGKSMNIPQYVAMTEAMGRKQLRTAMQGITAMTSAKQPTEREKLLSEMMPRQAAPSIMNAPPQGAAPQGAGLDQLPADNMQGLADGGIIAFSGKDNDQVVDQDKYETNPKYKTYVDDPDRKYKTYEDYLYDNAQDFKKDWLNSPTGKQATIQSQQMGEPSLTLPTKVQEQYWAELLGDSKTKATPAGMVAFDLGIDKKDLARMQAAQANPVGPKTPAGKPLLGEDFNARRTAKINEATANTAIARNSPEYEPVPATPAGRFIADQLTDIKGGMATDRLRQRLYEQYSKSADPFSKASDPERQAGQDMLSRIKNMTPAELRALEQQGNVSASAAVTGIAPPNSPAAPPNSPAAAPKTGGSTGAVPPKTGSGPGAGPNTGGSGTGGGPGGGSTGGPGGGRPGGGLPGTALSKFATEQAELLRPKERSKDYYEALTKPIEDIAKQVASGKSQAQGEFLMNIGAALMSTPNIGLAVAKGVQAGLPGLAASRKEINALTKDQRDYQFNIAKAKEARDQGDEMLALNYLKLAEESQKNAGMIGAYMMRASGGANALGPKQYQAAMKNATTAIDARIAKITNPMEKREATKNREQLIETEFTKNLQAYQTGTIPATQDPSLELFEKPGGPILTRPQK